MQEEYNINLEIFDEDLTVYGESLLKILLKDRTSGRNIIWATDDYLSLGSIYKEKNEINLNILHSLDEKFIRPRITKSFQKQSTRTKEKAEVFTPSWLCNEQNNLIDDEWFNQENVFNTPEEKNWTTNPNKIKFPKNKNKSWENYVDLRRLEITCGEAPYLVSRYDTVTGEIIPLNSRIGLLDRKLRVINENTKTEKDWYKWVKRAYQSIYGYEFQGDSLLLARENLLITFIDNLKYKFNREPTIKELKEIATIISWNIWQMDGLTYTVPFAEEFKNIQQLSLFEEDNKKPEDLNCKIKNWRSNKTIDYRNLVKGN